MTTTNTLHKEYLDLGFQPIPLRPRGKLPLSKGWQVTPTVRQWRNAPDDANIGLRAGNSKAFIDCDDKNQPGTFENVTRWLDGLGYHPGDYPTVQTASGVGRHVYVNFTGRMLGSKRNFVNQIGAGDFRYDAGAFVAAPPSVVDTGVYRLISGNLLALPVLDIRDIQALVNTTEAVTDDTPPAMSAFAQALAKGQGVEQYKTKSEAEQALILSMINSGFDYPAIKRTFDTMPCAGKYAELKAENSRNAGRWLELSYREALKYSENESPLRRKLAELRGLAERTPWKWTSDKHVLIAHLDIATKAGRPVYNASVRDLALLAGVNEMSASRANHRLEKQELITVERDSGGMLATMYALQMDKALHTLRTSFVRVCNGLSTSQPSEAEAPTWKGERIATHDAFRNGKGRLGQRAGQVYELLLANPDGMTEQEIAQFTGAHVKTIRRVLARLKVKDRKTGEVIEMATKNGDVWHGEIADLDLIAAIHHTYAAREEQRERYEEERADHRKILENEQMRKAGK